MTWNHRLMAHEYNGEVFLQIHEVFYDENGTPDGYTEKAVSIGGDSIKSIKLTLNRIEECLKKPVISVKDFPKECKIKYVCQKCGRDTFDKPAPHNCGKTFRKRGLYFETKIV